jgi:hypothetical protein
MDSRASYVLGLQAVERLIPILTPALIVSMMFLTMACASSSPYNRSLYLKPVVNISQGQLATKGVSIQAADGSFVFESGQSFRPPFQVDGYNLWYTTQETAVRPQDLTGRALNALEIGAEGVIVTTPYLDRPLFGVLLLSKVPANATGPGARSYYIDVPESYAREATGGRTSVVYERIRLENGGEWFNWALWMSDVDFPPLPGGKDRLSSAQRESAAFTSFDNVMQNRLQQQAVQASASDDDDLSWLLYLLLIGGLIYGLVVLAQQAEEAE